MRIDDLPVSEFTDDQWKIVKSRFDEFRARCEAAAWVVYNDRRYVGGFEAKKRSTIFKAAMKAMGLKKLRSWGGLDKELFLNAVAAAEGAYASQAA